ncbi:hypothetical protein AXF42_Ash016610 [Apostasia shenzhenica]|uniref:Uncharacterized protein n=1 Tax=Apostasia shenzhenica TaxID=1088818 RepID=A0A2I0A1J5_9ASPA|nr:hypothetical protein AXF42_Ash016610 [Apostasia shenzhenica]
MEDRRRWRLLSGLKRKMKGGPPSDDSSPDKKRRLEDTESPPEGGMGAAVVVSPPTKVAEVLVQVLESAQDPVEKRRVEKVVNVSDSPVKETQRAGDRIEVSVVHQMPAGESLRPRKILLKDENVEQFLPEVGIILTRGPAKTPLVICGPAPLGEPIPPPVKIRKPLFPRLLLQNEEKDEEEGSRMEEVATRERGVPQVASEGALSTEGTCSNLGDRLSEIRREEEKILENTSRILEVTKRFPIMEESATRLLGKMVELEGAMRQTAERSQTDHKTGLGY